MQYDLYIGTYTAAGAKGVYRLPVTADGHAAGELSLAVELTNPSWVTAAPDGRHLYAVEEQPAGRVVSLARTAAGLVVDGVQPSGGDDPCQLCGLPGGGLTVANYTDGSLTAFALAAGGALAAPVAVVRHAGHGPHPTRQAGPHLHAAAVPPGGQVLWTLDLGLDALTVYALPGASAGSKENTAALSPLPEAGEKREGDPVATTAPAALSVLARVQLPAGFGPRQLAFHPTLPLAYLVGELASELAVLPYDTASGLPQANILCRLSTLPPDWQGESWAASIRLHPAGGWAYVSNRGHDSVAAFALAADGLPQPPLFFPSGGAWPREIELAPDSSALLAAHQRGGGITRLPLAADGRPLEAPPQPLPAPDSSVSLAFMAQG